MFSHVMIGTNDLDKAKSFYDALLGTLGIPPGRVDRHRIFYRSKTGTFSVSLPIDGKPATCANGGTIGFAGEAPEAADAFHAAGLAHGGTTCEEPPGIREGNGMKLYIDYLRDPDGNKLCALHRMPSAETNNSTAPPRISAIGSISSTSTSRCPTSISRRCSTSPGAGYPATRI